MFPCIRSTGMSSEEFCEKLLQEEKVAVVPGNAFGDSGEALSVFPTPIPSSTCRRHCAGWRTL